MAETFDKVKILDTIRELAQELGHAPSRSEFREFSGITDYQVIQYFRSYRDALFASGVGSESRNLDDADLLKDWGEYVRKNHEIPTGNQYAQEGKYHTTTFVKHFGAWSVISSRFKQFARDKEEWSDVLSFLPNEEPKITISSPSSTRVVNPPKKLPRRYDISLGYIDPRRLNQLRNIKNEKFDLVKLIKLCEELNKSYKDESYFAVAMLVRAILDHVPPIFDCNDFTQVAGKHGGRSFKESMQHLDISSRKIADRHLHSQIRRKENLPYGTQVNFASDLDVLLEEIATILK